MCYKEWCNRIQQEHVYFTNSKYDIMRIPSELSVGICMLWPDIAGYFILFLGQVRLSIRAFARRETFLADGGILKETKHKNIFSS